MNSLPIRAMFVLLAATSGVSAGNAQDFFNQDWLLNTSASRNRLIIG